MILDLGSLKNDPKFGISEMKENKLIFKVKKMLILNLGSWKKKVWSMVILILRRIQAINHTKFSRHLQHRFEGGFIIFCSKNGIYSFGIWNEP